MKHALPAVADRFHDILSGDFVDVPTEGGGRHFIVQERDLRYRFHLHQHPYVRHLMQRLLRGGTAGLQAADTLDAPDSASLPGGLEIRIDQGTSLTLPAGSRIALLSTVQATSGGTSVELAAHMTFDTAVEAVATVSSALNATLAGGMVAPPPVGEVFAPPANSTADVVGDTPVTLGAASTVALHDGTLATLPAGTTVLLVDGNTVHVPDGVQVRLVKRRMQALLFADFFGATYAPNAAVLNQPLPAKELDFSAGGAYAVYNWELFFHVPLAIAMHLSKNQRFAEAQRWFHYAFDPTDDSDAPTPARFWKVRPFQTTDVQQIEELLVNLATGADERLRAETIRSMEAWKDAPFRPHVIARYRPQAYMHKTVMAYLDNLIAWGDSLFRQDTGEAIDEAMMVYVLAANILGPRPQPVPRKGAVRKQTYANLRQDLRQFGTVLRDVETDLPFDLLPLPADDDNGDDGRLAIIRNMGKALYFCVPRNDKLLGYWDTIADRLFKIRNSLNFQGVFRQLALFEPPIDPALLARAAAAGLDVRAIVSGAAQPQLPLVRFQFLVQRAAEVCHQVTALGNSLLSAMEKEDGEAMTLLRARHERAVMAMVEQVRYGQLQDAIKTKESLLQSLALAVQRYAYYERQLGKQPDEIEAAVPEWETLDKNSVATMRFAMREPEIALREIDVNIAQDLGSSGGRIVSSFEAEELEKSALALNVHRSAKLLQLAAQSFTMIPDINTHGHYWGIGGSIGFGGRKIAAATKLAANVGFALADEWNMQANQSGKIGSYARREQEWAFQSNLAAGEISQIFKQLRGAELRQAVAELELNSHRLQISQAEEIDRFLNEEGVNTKGKKANKALYAWMKREVRGLYGQCFQLAFDIARKAERALQHELGQPSVHFLQFAYDGGKEGLLAGEKLQLDLKRMELAYHDLNTREYELTRHVSLMQVNPMALLQLRTTGSCAVQLPETLFDMDGPGHYFRRMKMVAMTIPCVTGPYTGVNCTLTLLKSSIRNTPTLGTDGYARLPADDGRFTDFLGSTESIVTSSAQIDSGLFETNFRDERYLPFEHAGVISEWRMSLPADPSAGDATQFDYQTISDVILHVRYTAREGGAQLRQAALENLTSAIDEAQAVGSTRLFSVRDEFPTEWARFQNQIVGPNDRFELALSLRDEHYPFWSRGRLKTVRQVELTARSQGDVAAGSLEVFDKRDRTDTTAKKDVLAEDATLGRLLVGKFTQIDMPPSPVGPLKLFFDRKEIRDLWLAVTWGK